MIRKRLPVLLLLTIAAAARAQSLDLQTSLEFDAYVQHEAVTLTLRLTALGSTPFIVDDYGDYTANTLQLVVRHETDGYQEPLRQGSPFGTVMARTGEPETLTCRLNEWFSLAQQGRYTVQVVARRGGESVASPLLSFMIVGGLEISTVTRLLPDEDRRSRRYTLLYLPRNQREDLFLRIDDEQAGHVVALFRLGPVMRYERPRIEFGANGEFSVVQQISRDRFLRTRFLSDASEMKVLDRQQLVDPNQSVRARSLLESRERDSRGGVPLESFRRRERAPKSDEQP